MLKFNQDLMTKKSTLGLSNYMFLLLFNKCFASSLNEIETILMSLRLKQMRPPYPLQKVWNNNTIIWKVVYIFHINTFIIKLR